MSNDNEDATGKDQSFRTLRAEAGLPPEKRSDSIESLLKGSPMQDMADIMAMMRRKAERRAAEAESATNLLEDIHVAAPSETTTPPINFIHFPPRAAGGEND